jgi:membrane-bound lytic murein transglycosylase D
LRLPTGLAIAGFVMGLLGLAAGCGLKPAGPADTAAPGAEEVEWAGPGQGGEHTLAMERIAAEPAPLLASTPADSVVDEGNTEGLLAAADSAWASAADILAGGDVEGYRSALEEAFASLRRAEGKIAEDPAAFSFLRPAYEKLLAELREGAGSPEVVTELDASAEELARAAAAHPTNGKHYEMPIDPDDPLVAKYLALFQEGRRREFLAEAFSRSNRYRAQIQAEIGARGLPEELWVVPVIESGYKVSAYSRARAVGLWQFMTGTGRRYGLTVNEWVDERRDPVKSTRAALTYLKELYDWFNSWDFALAAYNRGEGNIHRDIEKSQIADFMEMAELGATHHETRDHVPQIHAAAIIAKDPEKYGFHLEDLAIEADTVVIDYVVDLEVVARCAGTTEAELRELNPELRTWITPVLSKDYPSYALKLPRGTGERYSTEIAKVEDRTPRRRIEYVVRRGDTLASIAAKFGVPVKSLQEWNHLRSQKISRGQRLVIKPVRGRAAEAQAAAPAPPSKAAKSTKVASTPGAGSGGELLAARVYTVKRGDTLSRIAHICNTTVDALRRLNGLGRSGRIFPGQKLRTQAGG